MWRQHWDECETIINCLKCVATVGEERTDDDDAEEEVKKQREEVVIEFDNSG